MGNTGVSLEELSELYSFIVFPNPTMDGKLSINGQTDQIKNISIVDALRRRIPFNQLESENEVMLNFSHKNSGMIIVLIELQNGSYETHKIFNN